MRRVAEELAKAATSDLAQVRGLIARLLGKREWKLAFPYAVQSIPALGENLNLIPEALEGLKSYMDFNKDKLEERRTNEMIELLKTIRAVAELI